MHASWVLSTSSRLLWSCAETTLLSSCVQLHSSCRFSFLLFSKGGRRLWKMVLFNKIFSSFSSHFLFSVPLPRGSLISAPKIEISGSGRPLAAIGHIHRVKPHNNGFSSHHNTNLKWVSVIPSACRINWFNDTSWHSCAFDCRSPYIKTWVTPAGFPVFSSSTLTAHVGCLICIVSMQITLPISIKYSSSLLKMILNTFIF